MRSSAEPAPLSRRSEPQALPGHNPALLVGTIVGAKLATIVVVLATEWSAGSGLMVAVTTWHWAFVVGALVAAPIAFAVRLRRVRARRATLLRAEWHVSAIEAPQPQPVAPPRMRNRR